VENTYAAGGIVIQGIAEIVYEAVFLEFLPCILIESVISKCPSSAAMCNDGSVEGLSMLIIEVDEKCLLCLKNV